MKILFDTKEEAQAFADRCYQHVLTIPAYAELAQRGGCSCYAEPAAEETKDGKKFSISVEDFVLAALQNEEKAKIEPVADWDVQCAAEVKVTAQIALEGKVVTEEQKQARVDAEVSAKTAEITAAKEEAKP